MSLKQNPWKSVCKKPLNTSDQRISLVWKSTRKILALSAFYCRKLAVRVAERDRTHLH